MKDKESENITCTVKDNSEKCEIIISGLSRDIKLSYRADVDFTELVRELTMLMDQEKIINFRRIRNLDEKVKLVIATIDDIFSEYNKCINNDK